MKLTNEAIVELFKRALMEVLAERAGASKGDKKENGETADASREETAERERPTAQEGDPSPEV